MCSCSALNIQMYAYCEVSYHVFHISNTTWQCICLLCSGVSQLIIGVYKQRPIMLFMSLFQQLEHLYCGYPVPCQ